MSCPVCGGNVPPAKRNAGRERIYDKPECKRAASYLRLLPDLTLERLTAIRLGGLWSERIA